MKTQVEPTGVPNGTSGETKQDADKALGGTPKVVTLGLKPLDVELVDIEADFFIKNPKTPASPDPGGDLVDDDFDAGTDAYWQHCREAKANQDAGSNYADPDTFTLGDRLITVACARMGRSEPQGKKRDNAVAFFKKALKDEGLLQGDVAMLEQAVKDWLDPEGDYNFYLPQYELTVKHELALRHFGIVLSKAKAQPTKSDRYARTVAHAEASQAAFDERMAAKATTVEGDPAWEAAKRELQLQMTKPTFDTWVRDTYGQGQENGVYTVVAPNALARDWLDDRLKTTAERTLVGILDAQVDVRFEVGE